MGGPITHVFFDLHGTLIDSVDVLPVQYRMALGDVMAARYGGDPADWAEANRRILEDWDSYYADLDLGGDDSLTQFREGFTRTTRALFRLTGHPYPDPAELDALLDDLPYAVTSRCDALYPDARAALAAIRELPLTLGVVSHASAGHADGVLIGSGVREWFTGPFVSPRDAGYFGKNEGYFRLAFAQAGVSARQCVVVDDRLDMARAAAGLNARVVLVDRNGEHMGLAHLPVMRDLRTLPDLLRGWLRGVENDD